MPASSQAKTTWRGRKDKGATAEGAVEGLGFVEGSGSSEGMLGRLVAAAWAHDGKPRAGAADGGLLVLAASLFHVAAQCIQRVANPLVASPERNVAEDLLPAVF